MVLDEIEIPRFSDFKLAVVDSAVRKNPAKWRERNKRRAQSRKNARSALNSEPTWEVPQVVPAEVEPKEDLKKVKDVKAAEPSPEAAEAVEAGEESDAEAEPQRRRKEGRTMPGGYYVRSMEEAHRQTMRAFNVRLCKPYQRPVQQEEEEELPPLEPEEEELDKATSSLPSRAARLAAQRLRNGQEVSREQQKKREEEEAERRREAERRVERRLLEAKIRFLAILQL
ncbi:unnamed protein product [Cladocopium goreaui]|uniref:Uncharacterized protein n=1 Tax=Cladocopium goreaui TaxID=2562237 RepID=A0A9P1BMI7_9DINO|nr:unnamed protein product [Cladocopium goreaui]